MINDLIYQNVWLSKFACLKQAAEILHWTESNYLCRFSIFYQPISNFVRVDHSGIWKEVTRVTTEQCKKQDDRRFTPELFWCRFSASQERLAVYSNITLSSYDKIIWNCWMTSAGMFDFINILLVKILSSIIPRISFLDRLLLLPATADLNLVLELCLPLCIYCLLEGNGNPHSVFLPGKSQTVDPGGGYSL